MDPSELTFPRTDTRTPYLAKFDGADANKVAHAAPETRPRRDGTVRRNGQRDDRGAGMNDDEHRIKHLEFIQSVINRMAHNSFVLKGWSVTLVAAIFVLAAKDANERYAVLALFPGLAFWALDAYYLRQARLFRKLYDAVRKGQRDDDQYAMNTADFAAHVPSWWSTACSGTVAGLHGMIIGVVAVVTAVSYLR